MALFPTLRIIPLLRPLGEARVEASGLGKGSGANGGESRLENSG
jgi:hypothetical protein